METLYITQNKCTVKRENEHLKIMRSGEVLSSVPLIGVKTIVVFDSVSITAPAMDLLMKNGIDIIYQSMWGKVKGRVFAMNGGGAILRLAQHSAFLDNEKRIRIAKSIVAAKIRNQMSTVRKYKYHDANVEFDKKLSLMDGYIQQLETADNLDVVMGLEGVSAKNYWECFRSLLRDPVFKRREYRPSPDYVNALLNLGYAFLANEVTTCLAAKQFDLEIGFLHSIHHGRNSLTLDIMEEFRSPFIDAWLLALLNKNRIKSDHFHYIDGDWRLTEEGFEKFVNLYHERAPLWHDKFREQANKIKLSLLESSEYEPYCE